MFRLALLLLFPIITQQHTLGQEAGRKINIKYGANFKKDEGKYPGASIFFKDDKQQVQFEHQGADLWCDAAIFYNQENRLRAIGNVRMQQGDSIELNSGFLEYNGETKLAKAYKEVILADNSMTLTTDTLFFDREQQKSYYNSGGKVVDSTNVLTSVLGTYFMEMKKVIFQKEVKIKNPDYTLDSEEMNYYRNSKNVYLYGPSTIVGQDYRLYCERGFYNTIDEKGYGVKNTRIDYNDRIMVGDSIYFNKKKSFASATNNIVITDTINKGVVRAHYAEVHKEKDSLFATKRAVAISAVEKDSLFIHGDTLMITGPPEFRKLRAFRNAKFFKSNLSGKCDSIHSEESTGVTQLLRNPILWNLENQMTGDTIHLISNLETEKLDSLYVFKNAFVVSKDTVGNEGYNQAKGIELFGKFDNNELRTVDLVKNTEVIYYMYNDKNEPLGINKTACSKIRLELENNDIRDITFFTNPDGTIYMEENWPFDTKLLKGFLWRGTEKINSKEEIFDIDDNSLVLPIIRGIDDPEDIDEEERKRTTNPAKAKKVATIPQKITPKKV